MTRRLPARIGATVVILHGEGYSPRRGGPRPRAEVRFLAGEFGTITAIVHGDEFGPFEHPYHVTLTPHPDYPDEGERLYLFARDDILVVPAGTTPNTSAMDNHPKCDTACSS